MTYTLQQLSDLEDIRQLKARYFRCIDTGNEAELATVFAEDVVIDLRGGGYRLRVEGRQNMVDFIGSMRIRRVLPSIMTAMSALQTAGRLHTVNMTGSMKLSYPLILERMSRRICWRRPGGSLERG